MCVLCIIMCNGLHESRRPVCVFQLSVSYLNTAPSLDRADVPKGLAELFFKQVKSWRETKGTHPPPTIVSSLITRVLLSYIPLPLYSSARRRWRSFSLHKEEWSLFRVCYKVQCLANFHSGALIKVLTQP